MNKSDCRGFLNWALPELGLRPAGFRRVRTQVCKRIGRRLHELGLVDTAAYRQFVECSPKEWAVLDSFCRITISRFYRDRQIFEWLRDSGLPDLAVRALSERRNQLRCWSAGCGGGEEPYSLRIMWDLCVARRFPLLTFEIVATDADPAMLARARRATYSAGSLREMPEEWIEKAFSRMPAGYELCESARQGVRFLRQDIRREMPDGPFDLILCRNLAFTYFDEAGQRDLLAKIAARLRIGGFLIVGIGETIPDAARHSFTSVDPAGVYRLQPDRGQNRQCG